MGTRDGDGDMVVGTGWGQEKNCGDGVGTGTKYFDKIFYLVDLWRDTIVGRKMYSIFSLTPHRAMRIIFTKSTKNSPVFDH